MSYEQCQFKASDGATICYHQWSPKNEHVRALVVIAHGMAEHAVRYNEFAEFLNSQGFKVYAPDHRGHGSTAGNPENTGIFASRQGWWKVVDDLRNMIEIAKSENPGMQTFLLGHSMGSFLVRTYLCSYGKQVDGVILSGTGINPKAVVIGGRLVAKISSFVKGQNHRSKLLDKLSFGQFNKKYNSPFQWLTRDNEIVERYISDPFCGQIFTSGFFVDLFEGLLFIGNHNNLMRIPKMLPVLIVSGSDDPVGDYGKGVLKVYNMYQDIGMVDVIFKLYDGARHEILNEVNRSEVYNDLVKWMKHKNLFHD
jgi:alpha-beta hydrolase superfamily lysophospholipase